MASFPFSSRVHGVLLFALVLGGLGGQPIASAAQQFRADTTDITNLRARKLFVRGMTQSYLEDYDEAASYFEKALDLSPEEPSILAALAEAEAARDNVTSALYYARQARDRTANNPYYHQQLAELLRKVDRPQDAAATYRSLLDQFPSYRQARLALARLQAELERPEKALRTYETLIDSSDRPRQAQVYREMLKLYRTVGDEDGQVRVLNILIELEGEVPRYRQLLGRLYLEQERYDDALPHFEALLSEVPNSPQLLSRLKMLYDRTGQPEKAEALWKKFKAKDASPDQLVTRARSIYEDARKSGGALDTTTVATAVQLLEDVLESDSTHVGALNLLGTIFYDTGDYARAARLLDRATDENPRSPQRWEQAAAAHLKAGVPQQALQVAEEGLLLFPGRPSLLRTLAFVHLRLDQNDSARTRFQQGLDKLDENAPTEERAAFQAGLGIAHDRLGNQQQADDAYETALELDSQQPKALRYYARSLAEREMKLDRALTLAQRAVELAPSDASALATLGWVQFQRGAVSEAKSTYERVLATGHASAAVYEEIGDFYRSLGNDTRARQYWKEALDRSPDRDSLREKLDALPKS